MTITSSGPVCDVCNKYILLEALQNFNINGIDQVMQCHVSCKPILQEAMKKKDWRVLPEGPIRRAFAEHEKQLEVTEGSSK